MTASALRPGDVIDLAAPDVVPADARLLVAEDLEVDESLLTGESLPVDKQVDPVAAADTERASMLFEGSTIVAGHARAIVVATGVGTAAHRAISAVIDVESSAGVQARLRELTGKVLPLTLAGGATVTGLALLRRATLRQAVADGVAIAVAAVPEGLPLVATLSQLAAAQRLSTRGVLVRAPRTIEALGRVDTICFDKTGTLTENRLRLVLSVPAATSPQGPFPGVADPEATRVLRAAGRASSQPHESQGHAHATDEAILKAAESYAGNSDSEWDLLAEVPFESSRGFAASIGTLKADPTQPVLMLKGAPEVVLPRCRFNDPQADLDHAESLVHNLAEQGLRVLAVAQRSWKHATDDDGTDADAVDAAAHDLELIGYVGLADTARPSSRPLIEALVDAGRDVVLITGDHPVTARAIARQLGLPDDARVITGAELIGLDEDAAAKLVADVQVFARVSPEQKVQIVGALQRCGRVTAMVGDGANDAAAIRMADVGIGVSGRGSSAARGAADIVLTDEDLGVLLDTLVEGRSMWAGVRDAVTILVGGNVGEVLFTIIGTALGSGRAPVGTRQLLLVNLLTDMFPALAVAVTPQFEEPDADEYETEEEAARSPPRVSAVGADRADAVAGRGAHAPDRHPWRGHRGRRHCGLGRRALDAGHREANLDNGIDRPRYDAAGADAADPPAQPARRGDGVGQLGGAGGDRSDAGCQPLLRLHAARAGGLDRRRGSNRGGHRAIGARAQLVGQNRRNGAARAGGGHGERLTGQQIYVLAFRRWALPARST